MNTRSAMASVRAHSENERVEGAVEHTATRLIDHPNSSVRVSTKIAQWVLLKHPTLISQGVTYSTQVKNVGAGVKELYLKEVVTNTITSE